ncbi:MAG: hypothetical protein ACYDHH_08280 [Solirubrobacteraceae bacterium]
MGVPSELVGAWRRSGLILDGVRQVDHCDVIWLQTPEWFADIRLRIDPTTEVPANGVPAWFHAEFAFAGVATFEPPVQTWTHLIDSNLEPSTDANPLSWEDGVVFETGKTELDGQEVQFIEEWLRMTGDDVAWSADTGDRHARIEVGRFAVELSDERPAGAFVATRYERGGTGWTEVGSVRT